MEINVMLRFDEVGENQTELFNIPKEDAKALEKEYETLALLENAKHAFIVMLNKYQDDSPKLAWIIFTHGKKCQEAMDFSFIMKNGSELFIQERMSRQFRLLLHSGASITEVRKVLS